MRYALNLGISAYQLDLGATGREKETLGECKGRQLRLPNGAGTGEQTDEAGSSPIACGSPPGLETKLEWFSVAGTEPAMVCSGQQSLFCRNCRGPPALHGPPFPTGTSLSLSGEDEGVDWEPGELGSSISSAMWLWARC